MKNRSRARDSRKSVFTNGYCKFPNVLVRNMNQLSAPGLRLFLVILSYKTAFPSYDEIRRQTGLSRGSITAAISELISKKIITVKRGHSRGQSNLYTIRNYNDWQIKGVKIQSSTSSLSNLGPPMDWTTDSSIDDPNPVRSLDASNIIENNLNLNIKNPQTPSAAAVSDSFFENRERQNEESKRTRNQLPLPNAYTQMSVDERQVRKFWADLQALFDGRRFLAEVPSRIRDAIIEERHRFDLEPILEFCVKNMKGKREKFLERMLESVSNVYAAAYDQIEYEKRAEIKSHIDEETKSFMAQVQRELDAERATRDEENTESEAYKKVQYSYEDDEDLENWEPCI